MKRIKAVKAQAKTKRIELFQLAEALELPPATVITMCKGIGYAGNRLPGQVEIVAIGGRKNAYECYLWFDIGEVRTWMNDNAPALLPTLVKNGRAALRTPVRPLPKTNAYRHIRQNKGVR